MNRNTVQLANDAFGCLMAAYFIFVGGFLVLAAVAVFLEFYWYGG